MVFSSRTSLSRSHLPCGCSLLNFINTRHQIKIPSYIFYAFLHTLHSLYYQIIVISLVIYTYCLCIYVHYVVTVTLDSYTDGGEYILNISSDTTQGSPPLSATSSSNSLLETQKHSFAIPLNCVDSYIHMCVFMLQVFVLHAYIYYFIYVHISYDLLQNISITCLYTICTYSTRLNVLQPFYL